MVGYSLGLKICNFIIIIIIYICLSTTSSADVYHYGDCSSTWSCGNVTNISYPFLWEGRPNYCGHPHLKLMCPPNRKDDYPILQITDAYDGGDVSFQVLGISNVSKPIKLRLDPSYFHYQNYSSCPTHFPNTYLFNKNRHKLTDLFLDIFFLNVDTSVICVSYNCSDPYHQDCQFFDIPTPNEELNKLQQRKAALENVLEQGFEVVMNKDKYPCIRCRNSGGVCGSSETSLFVCYCNDKTSLTECSKRKDSKLRLILGLAIPGGIIILIALNVVCCYMKKIKSKAAMLLSKTYSNYHTNPDLGSGNSFFGIPVFSYSELKEATNNFDSARELGDGGFGVVYHGKLRDGREVAVKRLYEKNYKRVGQFMNEIEILTNLRHQNLVTLYGCTSRQSKELLLVYEYIPNGTVADHLYGDQLRSRSGSKFKPLSWSIRMKIAIQTASALSYLHASDIIHRDVKTNNILVDNNFTVKVADFGLSRLFPFDATHVSTAPQGTPGYLDPEYHKCYQVTNKSDVYSFGVVLIELISSLPAIDINRNEDEINLSDYAMNKIQNGELDALVDRNLGFESDFKVKRMITLVAELAFKCLQQEKEVRPSMEEVFEDLKRFETLDYEALESKEMDRSLKILKPASRMDEIDDDHHQEHTSSPKSVIENCVDRYSTSDPSS